VTHHEKIFDEKKFFIAAIIHINLLRLTRFASNKLMGIIAAIKNFFSSNIFSFYKVRNS